MLINLYYTPQIYVTACLENKNNCVIIFVLFELFLTTTCKILNKTFFVLTAIFQYGSQLCNCYNVYLYFHNEQLRRHSPTDIPYLGPPSYGFLSVLVFQAC